MKTFEHTDKDGDTVTVEPSLLSSDDVIIHAVSKNGRWVGVFVPRAELIAALTGDAPAPPKEHVEMAATLKAIGDALRAASDTPVNAADVVRCLDTLRTR